MPRSGSVLIVDDDDSQLSVMMETLTGLGFQTAVAVDGQDALEKLESTDPDVIITDLVMPRMDGFEFLRCQIQRGDLTPAIVLTAFGSTDKAISVVHDLRAYWFLEKPVQWNVLESLLERAIQYKRLQRETEYLKQDLRFRGFLGDLIGKSRAMQRVFSLIRRAAPSSASVLISGESGTGKELVAREIHKLSPRTDHPFVAINCAAIPESLIESELFGHEKGAFTGAMERRPGCFEQAEGGTLFLDEIGEMPVGMQAKLLRVLEDKRVRRVGGKSEMVLDVRMVAATNRPLEEALNKRRLREDLYYRLNVFHIELPPLRQRKQDIPLIAEALIADLNKKHSTRVTELHPDVLRQFHEYDWPGNVRELRNVMERAVILAREGVVEPSHIRLIQSASLSPSLLRTQGSFPQEGMPGAIVLKPGEPLRKIEKAYIEETLRYTNGNKRLAAKILGISVRTLYTRLAPDQEASRGRAAGE